MNANRRDFLKIAGLSALVLIAPAGGLAGRDARGVRWAMAVDLNRCRSGCNDCILACHEAHNVPHTGHSKDEVAWIQRVAYARVFPEACHPQMGEGQRNRGVPVFCNHCAHPPCVRACPTGATFQRSDGIVMMDYHRCIGCKICLAACPYGARSINFRNPRPFLRRLDPGYPTRSKGVVEKCNFCEERLARGEAPACVLACKEKALLFGDAGDIRSPIHRLLKDRRVLRRRASLGTEPQVYYLS